MMKPDTVALKAGARKAVDAYGKTVGESLNNAVTYLQDRPQRLDEYIRALKIDAPEQLSGRASAISPQGARRSKVAVGARTSLPVQRSANSPQEVQRRPILADDVQRCSERVSAGQTAFFGINRR